MGHLPKLIEDLALILIAGAIITLIFRRIKQPLVLGYIIAGFLVGPYLSITPTVADTKNIKIWADIGVIFLLFSLGLEFSFKKLARVGGSATITAFVEIIFITLSGYLVGKWMGWSTMDSLFLGGMLASSSTTIIIRAFDELGVKTKQFAGIVFGVLIIEDIVVIVLMVLLSTVAITKEFEGTQMLYTILRLLFFLILWFIAGIFLIPTFLKRAKKLLDEEALLILSIGLCLGMVVLATQVGFSAELGAFIMGSILAETTSAEKVEHIIKPVKDLFGAVFFVSVGMLIDPAAIVEYQVPVICVTLLTLFGKLFSTTLGALLSAQPLKQSIQVGMSMAQIGEFAFIVATLGLSLGVISDFLFPVAVGASAITTFTTPYLIKFSEPFYNKIVKILPPKWVNAINTYSYRSPDIPLEGNWKHLLKPQAIIVLINAVIVLGLMLLSLNFLKPFMEQQIQNSTISSLIILILSLGLAAPFLWALMRQRSITLIFKQQTLNDNYRAPLLIFEIIRIIGGSLLIGYWIYKLVPSPIAFAFAFLATIISMLLFKNKLRKLYVLLEGRFIKNLYARENAVDLKNEPIPLPKIVPWDAHLVDLEVHPQAEYIGKNLADLGWREKFGINIAYIKRGDKLIYAPGRTTRLLPFDHIGILSTDEQIKVFKPHFDKIEVVESEKNDVEDIALQTIVVDETNKLQGLTIRNSGIRERTNGLIVGIERSGQRILNPDSTTVLEKDDILWLVGNKDQIQKLRGLPKIVNN